MRWWFMETGVNDKMQNDVKDEEAKPLDDQAAEAPAEASEAEKGTEQAVEEVDPLTALQEENAQLREETLRRAAELDNYRKRMAKELAESRKFSNQSLLSELLPVLDNFGMGMMMAEKEQGSMLYQGMSMVQGQLSEFFESQGVKPLHLEPGSDFDPNFHEAVSQEESEDVEEGKVLRTVRSGYLLGERLLRPANVVIAKAVSDQSDGEEEGA